MIWYYYYKIKYYSDDTFKENVAEGITCGMTWSEVVENISETYGENNIVEIHTNILGDGGPCFEIRDFNEAFKEQDINWRLSREED